MKIIICGHGELEHGLIDLIKAQLDERLDIVHIVMAYQERPKMEDGALVISVEDFNQAFVKKADFPELIKEQILVIEKMQSELKEKTFDEYDKRLRIDPHKKEQERNRRIYQSRNFRHFKKR